MHFLATMYVLSKKENLFGSSVPVRIMKLLYKSENTSNAFWCSGQYLYLFNSLSPPFVSLTASFQATHILRWRCLENSTSDWAAVLMDSYSPLSAGLPAWLWLLPILHLQKSNRHKAILLSFSTTCAISVLGTCPNSIEFDLEVSQPCHLIADKRLECFLLPGEVSFTQTGTHSLLRISLSLFQAIMWRKIKQINSSMQDNRHISCSQEYSEQNQQSLQSSTGDQVSLHCWKKHRGSILGFQYADQFTSFIITPSQFAS